MKIKAKELARLYRDRDRWRESSQARGEALAKLAEDRDAARAQRDQLAGERESVTARLEDAIRTAREAHADADQLRAALAERGIINTGPAQRAPGTGQVYTRATDPSTVLQPRWDRT